MHCGLATPGIVIVHARQIVMDETVGVHHLDCRRGPNGSRLRHIEKTRRFQYEAGAQPLPTCRGVAHRLRHITVAKWCQNQG
jgi:hypothetical protein